ncbi:hypothetical protein BN14_11711 [Rhizoctonia solani AG-1 IB]|uniref:F-box domain-containing protein n=1 Tax=Thanatephorus cucumeris (strain AG1-IB / isolate 7/3/14) TaxID=1108050 RepID=M5CEE2_THACB|nr:hypothetical protein BN14_11711 [Rhizoctonia solani AG-1 IB]
MVGSTLPTEVLAGVFGQLPPSNLAIASRVCREWKKVAFSSLYHTVYLCLAAHLEQFAKRILAEEVGSQVSIAANLKGLVLDIKYMDEREEEMITESDVANINAIIPRLTNLQALSWSLMFVPQDPETFQLFQTRCPKLTSVHIWIQDDIDFYGDQYTSLLGFKDLSHMSLSMRYLQRFRAHGHEDPDWTKFFTKPESNSLRQFFTRHPGIEDLGLGLFNETEYGDVIDPAQIAQLFPSLKHFEGPAFIFLPIVQSSLTKQIETLVIVDDQLKEGDIPLSKIYDKTSALPKLKKFGIWSGEAEEDILVNVLRTVVNAASQLEEVEIHPDLEGDYNEVVNLLKKLSNLRSITLNESVLAAAAENDGEDEVEWSGLASKLRSTCPKLRTIYKAIGAFGGDNREKVWELS